MKSHPTLSLVLVNYRSADTIQACLESLETDRSNVAIECIVVNNDSSERVALDRLAARFSIRVIETGENIGFGAASNRGAQEAAADFLGFLNPDTRLLSGSLQEVSEFFHTHPETGITGGRLIGQDGKSELWSAGSTATLVRIIGNKFRFFRGLPPERSEFVSVGFVSGAALFIRKSLFDSLGGFDERFFLYFEDMDLCLRSLAAGAGVVLLPTLVFTHEGGVSQCSREIQKRHYYTSQKLYFEKHRPKWECDALKFLRKISVR